ncbi:GNAT family N-acetyltransferase [Streptomyces sp. NPDC001889]
MSLETRAVTESEFPDWLRAVGTGFLVPPTPSEQDIQIRRADADLARTIGAFDDGRCVATYRSFAQRLTVPGGATVSANAVTAVTVTPTHRRRGLLSGIMNADLAVAKERGDAVASLIAAEYPIYGRFGFGPAASTAVWEIDLARAGLDRRWSGPDGGGRIDLVDAADARKLGAEVHAGLAAFQHGVVSRPERWWELRTGKVKVQSEPWTEPFYAVYRSAAGEAEGMVVYSTDGKWSDAKQPDNVLTVRDLVALNPAAERALWTYVCSIDWVTSVRSGRRAPDDLLPELLPDPRAARMVAQTDFLWVRILDVVRALEARAYDGSGSLVLEIEDPLGLADGRFRVEVSPEGAGCRPTSDEPDLTMGVRELGALYLGDASPTRLLALGTLREHHSGAARTAEFFRTPRRPWCPDIF